MITRIILNFFKIDSEKLGKQLGGMSLLWSFIAVILIFALVVVLAAIDFWLVLWAVATLFHVTIAFTLINYLAYIILAGLFSGSKS